MTIPTQGVMIARIFTRLLDRVDMHIEVPELSMKECQFRNGKQSPIEIDRTQ